ncbi:N-acetylglucosamine-6-phosphate deacetylase [Petrotoga sp. HWH.PT.55.6.1]|uniref:N-acetylglucosamine-6-phosphate deacetylase n=1 Tax=unclassified Petrotoga TaxID=2620614 RepID=UPI000CA04F92|nr:MULTISPECIES: N-acetylglucosamine-6-phosphate deacetylase [unclassified Petrotoga]PNR94109.1 N-acetylglucosamine-6-phosphate deacetylase [Petrotoga sp. HWHPT.55.6.3]RPD35546.1 N-acetylglucosamine-6-phosphate deacetylase [Petrotoga sp. HWH.PT.55.6.1]
MRLIIRNGSVITPIRVIDRGGIIVEKGKISEIFTGEDFFAQEKDKIIDAEGNYISPGFIDIHSHGGGGYDFMDGSVEAIEKGSLAHLKYGTTSIVPTTLTSTKKELFKTLDSYRKAKEQMKNGPNLIGIHLEGPYLSMEQRGAQDPRYIKNPEPEEYEEILNYSDDIIRWTIAPELKGALEMGRKLVERGILPSIGHTNAIYEEVLKAFECGFSHITHLYSGMSMVKRINAYRYAGVVESAFLLDDASVEIIADGKHLPSSLLKLVYKIKGPEKICLVTDSMRAAGMPDGVYTLGSSIDGQKVIVEEGVAKLLDKSAFAGSVATASRLVKTMVTLADVPLQEAVKMMTLTPAKIIKIDDRKGSLTIGKDADIVIFDKDINILKVIINGEIQYEAN